MSNKSKQTEEDIVDDSARPATEENIPEDIEQVVESEAELVDPEGVEDDSESELDQLKDQLLRAQAEMANVRRRSEDEVSKARKFAIEGLAKELLGARDSLQLAAQTELEAEDSDAVKSMHEGLELTLKQLDAAFAKFAIVEVASEVGDKLDPNIHQAMTMIPSEEVESGCIVSTIQKGYQIHDRLLRPAMVVVSKK